MKKCAACDEVVKRTSSMYCSTKCAKEDLKDKSYNLFIEKWKAGLEEGYNKKSGVIRKPIRRYIMDKFNNKCTRCGWSKINPITGKIPLTVEHIDGDWKNNKEDNLDLICPNCHSLTSTYGNLNKGNGRPFRH